MYKDFGLENYSFRLSYRDPADTKKYYADDEMWEKAQGMLKEAMDEMGLDYYEAEGEAAFYGQNLMFKFVLLLEKTKHFQLYN